MQSLGSALLLLQKQRRVLTRRWRRRLTFAIGALCVGLIAVAFAKSADIASNLFSQVVAKFPLSPLLLTPAGFALSVWLIGTAFPNTQGSGIPQAIAARTLRSQHLRAKFVSIRAAIGKCVLTLVALLVGGSVGREGPTVQVGASLMFAAGRLSERRQPGLVLAGAAGGVAAAFNTPLAGIVFAIEEIGKSFESKGSTLIITAVIMAGMTSLTLIGDYAYFGATSVALPIKNWLSIPVLGIAGGLLGGVFSRLLIQTADGFPGPIGRFMKAAPISAAAVCGLLVAVIGLASNGLTYGTGYDHARLAVHGSPLPVAFLPFKFLATAVSSISGIAGGIFSPSLSIGAGLGADLSVFFPSAPLSALVLLGMAAYLSGVVQAPITSFVIVSEVTNDHHIMLPLMATSLLGAWASKTICKDGLYHALATRMVRVENVATPPSTAPSAVPVKEVNQAKDD